MGRKFNICRQLGFIWLAVSCVACEPKSTASVATDIIALDVVSLEGINVPNVRILPERPTSRDTLTAQLLSPEEGAEYQFRWIVDGELLDEQRDETLPGGIASRGQSVLIEVSASRDGRTSPWGGASVIIGNAPPVCLQASILPNPPTIFDSIECRCDDLDDPDDGLVDTSCSWSDLEPTWTSCSRPAPHHWLADTLLTCELTVIDSLQDAGTVIASTMVINTPPIGGQVGLQPDQIFEDSQVRCLASGATDPDGVFWNYELLVDGLVVAAGPDIEINGNSFDKGQSIQCIATAADGMAKGQPITSETVVVGDSPASVVAIQATPPVVNRLQTPLCDITMTDPDLSDTPESVTTWWRNGVLLDWEPTSPLGATVVPGDTMYCSAVPLDYPGTSTPKISNSLTVENLGPVLVEVDILPEAPTITDVLECVPYANDPEGDPMAFSYSWSVNGAQITDASATLSGIAAGSLVQCEVQASDAYGDIASMASSTIVVMPSPPQIDGVAMLPTNPGPCDTVSCVASNVSDPDGTSNLTIATTLLLNGVPTSETSFTVGAELQCVATITDETGLSVTASSPPNQVTNTPPTLSAVTISPAQPTAGDSLTCAPVDAVDPDCNTPPTADIEWVSEAGVTSGSSLQTAVEQAGQQVTCSLTMSDGYDSSTTMQSTVTLAPPPSLPVVTVTTDINGSVICAPESPLESPSWFWRVGNNDEFQGPWFLPPSTYQDCDRVTCRAESNGLSTNIAEALLPMGPACDDGSPCTLDTCSPAGGCSHTALFGACDDGDDCTDNDACQGAVCSGIPTDCDDDNPCTAELCVSGFGCNYGYANGPCDDGDACTLDDQCIEGSCGFSSTAECDDGDVCTDDTCDPELGCIGWPNVSVCDDGNSCTHMDMCADGDCQGEPLTESITCPNSSSSLGYCSNGVCVSNVPPQIPILTISPTVAQAGNTLTCSAVAADPDGWPEPVQYTFRWTQEPAGIHVADGPELPGDLMSKGDVVACRAMASDGLLSSLEAVELANVVNAPPAVQSVSLSANDTTVTCSSETYDPDTEDSLSLSYAWFADGLSLPLDTSTVSPLSLPPCSTITCEVTVDDGHAINAKIASPLEVDNPQACGSEPCLIWSCSANGCASVPGAGACNDGNPCTGLGTCINSVCIAEPLPDEACDDGNVCTTDSCNADVGCVHTPVSFGVGCNADDSVCTEADFCNAMGTCIPGPPISCDDGIACTSNVCAPTDGCIATLPGESIGFAIDFGMTEEFLPFVDEAVTELVQGPQGGEHIEFSLKYLLPSSFNWQPLRSRVIVTLEGPCCGDLPIGGMYLPNVLSDLEGPNTYVSGMVIGIFDQEIATGSTVCATVEVTIYDEPGTTAVNTSIARHMFTIVDNE